jgi:hypothetical protein
MIGEFCKAPFCFMDLRGPRPLKACHLYGAKLVIAKIDRLSRDAHFLLGLEKAGVDFVAADKEKPLYALWTSAALVADTALRGLPSRFRPLTTY